MDQRDRDNHNNREDDDGIVAEDVTQLVEHIELTSPQRLLDAPEWELARPAADLDDAPIMLDDIDAVLPDAEREPVAEDLELFTETQFDLGRHAPAAERTADHAAEHAAERLRWQKRIESLKIDVAERDQLLAEREHRIEELSARVATLSLERASLAAELRRLADHPEPESPAPAREGRAPVPPATTVELPAVAQAAPESTAEPAAATAPEAEPDATAETAPGSVPMPSADATAELPALAIRRQGPAAARGVRRYLIGLDLVGVAHELAGERANIGRTQDNDLRVLDPTVSRLHAMLSVRNGEAMLVDANSRNGVFVNGIQVRYAKLEDGDVVTFGTVRFRYRVGASTTGSAYGAA